MPRQLRPARRGSGAASGRKASLPFHSPELRRRHRAGARTGGRPGTDPGRSEEMVSGHHRQSEGGGGKGRRRVCAVLNGASERTEIHDVGNRREYSQLTSGPRKHTMPSLSETLFLTVDKRPAETYNAFTKRNTPLHSELWRLSTRELGPGRRPFQRKLPPSPARLPPTPHSSRAPGRPRLRPPW